MDQEVRRRKERVVSWSSVRSEARAHLNVDVRVGPKPKRRLVAEELRRPQLLRRRLPIIV